MENLVSDVTMYMFDSMEPKDIIACLMTGKLFHVLTPSQYDVIRFACYGMHYCIRHNKLNSCKYLYQKGYGRNEIYDDFNADYNKWMKSIYWVPKDDDYNNDKVDEYRFIQFTKHFKYACVHGYLEMAQWLYGLNQICIHEHNLHEIYLEVCQNGQLEVLKWLMPFINKMNVTDDDSAYDIACTYGHIKVIEYLREIKYNVLDDPDVCHYYTYGIRRDARFGNLATLKWFYELNKENFIRDLANVQIHNTTVVNAIITHAISTGDLKLIKWITKFQLHDDYVTLANLKTACHYKKLDMMKHLLYKKKDLMASPEDAMQVLSSAMKSGSIKVARYIYERMKDKFVKDNNLFRIAYRATRNKQKPYVEMMDFIQEIMKEHEMPIRFKTDD